jgi:peptidoglycan/xylan/chitin deacetylase (PgdA/CDA1 family)
MKYILVLIFSLFSGLPLAGATSAARLIEYHMHMPASDGGAKRVALTFDACMGKVDDRILNALVDNNIKATVFVTARWMKYNARAIAVFKGHPDLFEIEDHGAQHVPAVDEVKDVFGLKSAGSADAVAAEVEDGAAAVQSTFGHWPQWYRGAAAIYTNSSMDLVKSLDFKLGGFSMSGDGGASWTASHAQKAIAAAKDGDVIIAHINQPTKPAGAGVVEGILRLKELGFNFVTLDGAFHRSDGAERKPSSATWRPGHI